MPCLESKERLNELTRDSPPCFTVQDSAADSYRTNWRYRVKPSPCTTLTKPTPAVAAAEATACAHSVILLVFLRFGSVGSLERPCVAQRQGLYIGQRMWLGTRAGFEHWRVCLRSHCVRLESTMPCDGDGMILLVGDVAGLPASRIVSREGPAAAYTAHMLNCIVVVPAGDVGGSMGGGVPPSGGVFIGWRGVALDGDDDGAAAGCSEPHRDLQG